MKRILALALLLACMVSGAAAQEMRVFVSGGAMDEKAAARLTALLGREFPQAQWALEHETQCGMTLAEMVLCDRAPQIALCPPGEALPWAKEGLLVPLTKLIADQKSIAPEVLCACTEAEELFVAPLTARQRQMAVNRKIMEEQHLGYLLNPIEHPAWLTSQFYQVLEEMMLTDQPALEIWPAKPEDCEAMAALLQTIYGGRFFGQDETDCMVDSPALHAGVEWLHEMHEQGMITSAPDRQTALERFVAGETALFLDWTQELEKAYSAALDQNGVDVVALPYPSVSGDVVRVFELTGAAVFDSGDEQTNMLAQKAVAFLDEDVQAQLLLGDRAIYRDEAQWLAVLGTSSRGVTLRALLCDALEKIMSGEEETHAALSTMQAAMDALGRGG